MYRVLCLALCLASVLLASDVFLLPTKAVAHVPTATAVPSAATTANIEEKVFHAINRFRAEQNLVPLSMAKDLAEVARLHSQDMATRAYFDHISPDGNTLRKRVLKFGITNWSRLAENIAMNFGQLDPAEVAVRGWLNSQGHRLNILDQDLTETGIGVAVDAKGRIYLTQLFARRK
jgi:uncharacterized protein YkwD